MTAPPFAYYGGKTRLASKIIPLLPPHKHYVEPFAGSLAVLLAKPPALMETANDLDGDLVHFWRMLRDNAADLIRACALTPHARAEHHAAYEPTNDDIERARRTWVLLTQGRGGQLNKTGWRFVSKPTIATGMPKYLHAYVTRMEELVGRLKHVSLECRPAIDVVAQYGRHDDVLLYVDPPYLNGTRVAGGYRHEMAGTDDHEALATVLRGCKAAVVLSGYLSPLYDELYTGWHTHLMPTATTQGDRSNSERLEVLWANRPFDLTNSTASVDQTTPHRVLHSLVSARTLDEINTIVAAINPDHWCPEIESALQTALSQLAAPMITGAVSA